MAAPRGALVQGPTFSLLQAMAEKQCGSCPAPKSPGGRELPSSIIPAMQNHLSGKQVSPVDRKACVPPKQRGVLSSEVVHSVDLVCGQ